jgi:hypothetical protein
MANKCCSRVLNGNGNANIISEKMPIPSVQKWPLQGCRAFLSKVMYDFSFRLIFFNKIVRFLTVMNLKNNS